MVGGTLEKGPRVKVEPASLKPLRVKSSGRCDLGAGEWERILRGALFFNHGLLAAISPEPEWLHMVHTHLYLRFTLFVL